MTKLSIIIPCYNHGQYIQDAIESLGGIKGIDFEVIIVDDGSTDLYTINKLNDLKQQGYTILSHENRGLAYSRNRGIDHAEGQYILPLDADNKIKPDYIHKACAYIDSGEVDIVYADPIFFGENISSRFFKPKDFDGYDLYQANYIDACAIYKKEVWKSLGGYDCNMPYPGHEDWEFWLHAFIKGYRFKYIKEGLYYYRIVKGSMIETTIIEDTNNLNQNYIITKHKLALLNNFQRLAIRNRMFERDQQNPLRSSAKYLVKYFKSLTRKRV